MLIWKKEIFVRAIIERMKVEQHTADQIIQEYVKLTENEKQEILASVT